MRVVLIGGSRLLRGGLKLVLEESGAEIVGEYGSTDEVTPPEAATVPVIYLLMHSPGCRGIRQEIGALRDADAGCLITVMLSRLAANDLVEVFTAGGDGLVLEELSAQALQDSLRLVALGEKVFPSQLATLLSNDRRSDAILPQSPLTRRECEIVRRLALGKSNKEIANDLAIAPATVKVHVKSLLKKLDLNNRTQAAIWALNAGLVDSPEVTVNAGHGLRHEPQPSNEAETALDRSQCITPERRTAAVQSSVGAPNWSAPSTRAVRTEMLFRPGYGETPPRLFTPHTSKKG